jgi:hypothetical protein
MKMHFYFPFFDENKVVFDYKNKKLIMWFNFDLKSVCIYKLFIFSLIYAKQWKHSCLLGPCLNDARTNQLRKLMIIAVLHRLISKTKFIFFQQLIFLCFLFQNRVTFAGKKLKSIEKEQITFNTKSSV